MWEKVENTGIQIEVKNKYIQLKTNIQPLFICLCVMKRLSLILICKYPFHVPLHRKLTLKQVNRTVWTRSLLFKVEIWWLFSFKYTAGIATKLSLLLRSYCVYTEYTCQQWSAYLKLTSKHRGFTLWCGPGFYFPIHLVKCCPAQ